MADGWHVRGVDAFTTTDVAEKEDNVARPAPSPSFSLVVGDLATVPLRPLLADADVVVHLAAQPGVRASFGAGFARYDRDNVFATQRLLEAALDARVGRVVLASSSSVYGDAPATRARSTRRCAALALRGDQAGGRGPRRRLPGPRPRHRRAAVLHGLRAPPAA